MNVLEGKIASVKVSGSLSLVTVRVGETLLSAIVIDTPETTPYLNTGNVVKVIFKETEVIVGSGTTHHISLQNKLIGTIQSIETEDLLGKLMIDTSAGQVTAIITANAIKQLQLKQGSEVTAMIKTNEMMLSQ